MYWLHTAKPAVIILQNNIVRSAKWPTVENNNLSFVLLFLLLTDPLHPFTSNSSGESVTTPISYFWNSKAPISPLENQPNGYLLIEKPSQRCIFPLD